MPAQCSCSAKSFHSYSFTSWLYEGVFFMAKSSSGSRSASKESSNKDAPIKVITVNRAAYHDYFVERTIEAGISLVGTEIKSIREGKVKLRGSYAIARNGELWLENTH